MSSITGGNYNQIQNIENVNQTAEQFASLQSDIDENKIKIAQNTASIQSNELDISQNTADIATLQNDVSSNLAFINQNILDISQNTADIATLQNDVSSNLAFINQNILDISQNTTDISTLQNDVSSNLSFINQNTLDISQNTASIQSNDTDIGNILGWINANTPVINQNTMDISQNAADIFILQNDLGNIVDHTAAIEANTLALTDITYINAGNTGLTYIRNALGIRSEYPNSRAQLEIINDSQDPNNSNKLTIVVGNEANHFTPSQEGDIIFLATTQPPVQNTYPGSIRFVRHGNQPSGMKLAMTGVTSYSELQSNLKIFGENLLVGASQKNVITSIENNTSNISSNLNKINTNTNSINSLQDRKPQYGSFEDQFCSPNVYTLLTIDQYNTYGSPILAIDGVNDVGLKIDTSNNPAASNFVSYHLRFKETGIYKIILSWQHTGNITDIQNWYDYYIRLSRDLDNTGLDQPQGLQNVYFEKINASLNTGSGWENSEGNTYPYAEINSNSSGSIRWFYKVKNGGGVYKNNKISLEIIAKFTENTYFLPLIYGSTVGFNVTNIKYFIERID